MKKVESEEIPAAEVSEVAQESSPAGAAIAPGQEDEIKVPTFEPMWEVEEEAIKEAIEYKEYAYEKEHATKDVSGQYRVYDEKGEFEIVKADTVDDALKSAKNKEPARVEYLAAATSIIYSSEDFA